MEPLNLNCRMMLINFYCSVHNHHNNVEKADHTISDSEAALSITSSIVSGDSDNVDGYELLVEYRR